MYVLQEFERGLYTVGFFVTGGRFITHCSLNNREMAERMVNYLNGGNGFPFDLKTCVKNPDVGPWPGGPLPGTL
jgi:hypothetical protein